jgi:hypothetical protein
MPDLLKAPCTVQTFYDLISYRESTSFDVLVAVPMAVVLKGEDAIRDFVVGYIKPKEVDGELDDVSIEIKEYTAGEPVRGRYPLLRGFLIVKVTADFESINTTDIEKRLSSQYFKVLAPGTGRDYRVENGLHHEVNAPFAESVADLLVAHLNNPSEFDRHAQVRAALNRFVDCVNVSGGVRRGDGAPCGDPDWPDLGDTYKDACIALDVPMLIDTDADWCSECGCPARLNEDGTTNHLDDEDEIDHDADASHVAVVQIWSALDGTIPFQPKVE